MDLNYKKAFAFVNQNYQLTLVVLVVLVLTAALDPVDPDNKSDNNWDGKNSSPVPYRLISESFSS